MNHIDQIIDRWLGEPDFRTAFAADPKAACAGAGIEASADTLEALAALDMEGLSGGTLPARCSLATQSFADDC